jgi:DNA-binding NtrC family response regulator
VRSGPDAGKVYESSGERVVVGTHESTGLVLTDATVSRFHCEIAVNDGLVHIADLGSRNGTLLDGVSVLSAHLHDGAVLTLGRSEIAFELGAGRVEVPTLEQSRFGLMVGRSPAMRAVFALLESAARSSATVLLLGETGTGKDAAAESIHREGDRSDGPLVVVDCAGMPPALIESELFGHERGAFTGADRTRLGAFEAASGGTLLLDEVGELPLELQPKLLRVLESRTVQRVGTTQRVPVDVRVIAATNRNLKSDVNAQRFRPDLYYRLAVLEITLPPLRERREDLQLLVEELLARRDGGAAPPALVRGPSFARQLADHDWPGNVRELRNYLERCLALERAVPLDGEDPADAAREDPPPIDARQPIRGARERWVRYFERRYLEDLLAHHGGNVSAAARAAGVTRIHLYRLLTRAGLRP